MTQDQKDSDAKLEPVIKKIISELPLDEQKTCYDLCEKIGKLRKEVSETAGHMALVLANIEMRREW